MAATSDVLIIGGGVIGSAHRPSRLATSTRALLINWVYEVDPLECPKCGGTMKIISIIDREPRRGLWWASSTRWGAKDAPYPS